MNTTSVSRGRAVLATLLVGGLAAAALTTTAPAGAADQERAAAPWNVTLKANAKEAVQGEEITLKGRVAGGEKGQKVTLQLQYEGRKSWSNLGKTKLNASGKFKTTDKLSTTRDRTYRVLVPADKTHSKGLSKGRFVESYGWRWLGSFVSSAQENVIVSSLPINGEVYDHTIFANRIAKTAYAEYTLGRKCTQLETTFGLSDQTTTGGQATIKLTLDGAAAFEKTYGLGQSDLGTFDVEGVYRLRLDFAQVVGTPETEPAAGAAQVLCD